MLVRSCHHLKHHARFYTALVAGIAVWLATGGLVGEVRFAAAGDVFYGVYLVSTAPLAFRATADTLRRRAAREDVGVLPIVLITAGAIVLGLWSIFSLINAPSRPGPEALTIAIASVPLGWLTLHTVIAFHYAHLYYTSVKTHGEARDRAELAFPGTTEPTVWDFLYYSFVIGMTAQVSDVQTLSTAMRRLTMAHGIVSFFYNTVLLALAVNLIVSQGH